MLCPPSAPMSEAIRPCDQARSTSARVVARARSSAYRAVIAVDRVDLLERGAHGCVALQGGRDEDRPELGADPALPQARQVGVGGAASLRYVEPVEVVAGPLPRLPGEVVVPVDDRVPAEEVADAGRGVRGHALDPTRGARERAVAQLEWRHGLSLEPRQRGAGHPRVHPQRGRLRGAGRAPGGRGVDPRRRRRRRRRRGGQHLRLRRAGQEGLDRHAARGRRPQGDRPHQGRRRGRAASPSATARPSPTSSRMPTRCSASTPTATCPATSPPSSAERVRSPTCRPTAGCCCRSRRSTAPRPPPEWPFRATGPTARPSCARGSTHAPGHR